MTTRTLTLILVAVGLLLSVSWLARNYLAHMRCDGLGRVYEAGKGCVEPKAAPPVFIERGLKRT